MNLPRGLVTGTTAALAWTWGVFAVAPGRELVSPIVQSAVYLVLLVVTARSRRIKVLIVRTFQRWTINPLMRLLLSIGINPLGLAILETRGRVSGKPRRTPVGNGRVGSSFWIIAEHGARAGYVRNIQHDPRVRVRLRVGWRYRWVPGIATVLPDDDALARQRRIIRWHPLRAFNAMNVRVLGVDLLTVHVQLLSGIEAASGGGDHSVAAGECRGGDGTPESTTGAGHQPDPWRTRRRGAGRCSWVPPRLGSDDVISL